MPDTDTYIEFEKRNTKLPCPFVTYGDFECLTTNSKNCIKGTYQEHKPCGYKCSKQDCCSPARQSQTGRVWS